MFAKSDRRNFEARKTKYYWVVGFGDSLRERRGEREKI